MAINKKLLFFKKEESFNTAKNNGDILDRSIVFIKDSKPFIYTHQTEFPAYNPNSFTLENTIDWNSFIDQSITFSLDGISEEDFIVINSEPCKILYIGDNLYVVNKEGKIAKISNTTFTVLRKSSTTYTLSSITDLTSTSFTEDITTIQLGDNISISLEDKLDSTLVFTLYSKYLVDGNLWFLGTCFKESIIYDVLVSPETKVISFTQRPDMQEYVRKDSIQSIVDESKDGPVNSKAVSSALNNIVTNKVEVMANTEEQPSGNLLIVNADLSNDEFPTGNYTAAISPFYLRGTVDEMDLITDTSVVKKVLIGCPIAENTRLEAGDNKALTISNLQGNIQLEAHHTTEQGEDFSYFYQIPKGAKDGSSEVLALRSDIPKVSCISIFSDSINIDTTTFNAYGDYNKVQAEAFFKYAESTTDDRSYTFTVARNGNTQRVTTKDYYITTTNEESLVSTLWELSKALVFTFYMPVPVNISTVETVYQTKQFALLIIKAVSKTDSSIIYKYAISPESSVGSGDSFSNALTLIK